MTNPTTKREQGAPLAATAQPLLIIAAGGALPFEVAEAAVASGRPVFLVGLDGEVDARIDAFPHTLLKWGQVGRLQKIAAEHRAREVVLVGAIARRPDFKNLGFDPSTLKLLPRILKALAGGDDTVLGHVVRILEEWGLRVLGAHEVATGLVAAPGRVAGPQPTEADLADAHAALAAIQAIGPLDIGQAAIAIDRRVVAVEAAEGTDAMVRRIAELRAAGRFTWTGRSGVLAKCAKPTQDLRIDMPTIGPHTVEQVAETGLAGIAIEAGRVMIANRPATLAAAERTGTFIYAADLAGAGRGG
jgi:DUF1009 family protein